MQVVDDHINNQREGLQLTTILVFRGCTSDLNTPYHRWTRNDETHQVIGSFDPWNVYLAVVLDLYSRATVSWFMAERITKELVMAALTMALFRRRRPPGLILDSDSKNVFARGSWAA